MKQGIFCNNRIKLLLSPGASGYRAKRKGERKRKSIRGCIVGPDIKTLSLILVKKGEKEIPGLTDESTKGYFGETFADQLVNFSASDGLEDGIDLGFIDGFSSGLEDGNN